MKVSGSLPRTLLIATAVLYLVLIFLPNQYSNSPVFDFFTPYLKTSQFSQTTSTTDHTIPKSTYSQTNLNHLVFGLVGSENAWHHRKAYIESWWRPNITKGFIFLDKPPSDSLLPWSSSSPPYRISDDLTKLLKKVRITPKRIIHAIMEVFREVDDHKNLRWLVMGDEDSIFFIDNIVDVLATYDHTKYYYIGGHSEYILSNFWFSFRQGFGGAGIILSYPLAKALAEDMENCLIRYKRINSADKTTGYCVADIGVNLTPLKGMHQMDLRGDISGFLSSHPNSPLMSLHHFDMAEPIFPSMDRYDSTRHLMTAAAADQSRMLQQTICHHRQNKWTFSISWGYSAHIYERIMPRSVLQCPIETFKTWTENPAPPHYMFNTRRPSSDPCEAPHEFFFHSIERTGEIVTSYNRAWPRGLPACSLTGNYSAHYISKIIVFSPPTKRVELDRSECCDVVRVDGSNAEVKLRKCVIDEIIA
ncbi:hypothetical protein BUALT_Bualt02G0179900 [Buddleja alternifolia]|uniref:Uncharacterized protein n=1 Tax=Buddleja alternifolia TaxID=168488 RepID=A0AAV6Y394_9LAMI|nr:hypothetical protein BUALT_Bualt02G0179900 [Buddleja alternifolia]